MLADAVQGGVPNVVRAGPTCPNRREAGRYRVWVGAPRAKDCCIESALADFLRKNVRARVGVTRVPYPLGDKIDI